MSTWVNYGIVSHATIRHQMYDGYGPSNQGDTMLGWRRLAERLSSVRDYVDTAITGVRAAQQGAAADAAVGAMTPLGAWVDETRRLAIDTGNKIDEQISAFTTAKGNVPEVPPEPRGRSWKDLPVIDAFTTSDHEADEAFNREQERQARAAMASYQDSTNTRLADLAQFAPPPAGEPNLAIPAGQRSQVGARPGAGRPGAGGHGVGGHGGSGSRVSAAAPGSPTPLAAGVAAATGGLSAAAPASTSPQSGGDTGAPEYAGGRPAPGAFEGPGGFLASAPLVAGPVDTASSRVGAGRAEMRGGSAVRGFEPSAARVPVGSGRVAGGFGPIGSPESVAARGASVSAAGVGRAAGVSGAGVSEAGTSGITGPFGGMGGGRGGEDKQRRRPSYLVEPDSTRLIGDLPPTVPSVIGEDPPGDGEPDRC